MPRDAARRLEAAATDKRAVEAPHTADPFGKPNFGSTWQYLQHFSIAAAVANITTCCLGYHSNASVATIVLLFHSDVSLRKLKRHTWFQRRCITHGIIY